jgi:hypothetical protein
VQSVAQPATIAQTAYGNSSATTDAAGLQFGHLATTVPAASLLFLTWVRWSLPSGDKHRFDMSVAVVVGTIGVLAGARLVAHRHIAEGSPSTGWQVLKVFTG